MDRRKFLQAGSAAIAFTTANSVSQASTLRTPRDKKRVCLIGCGWYGKIDLFRLLQVEDVEVVSLCDVDSKMLAEAADMVAKRQKSGNRPKTYGDYRELLADGGVDIALIDTPDHWHALPMIEACQKGLDVYVQKPIGVDVIECQAMLAAARKHKRCRASRDATPQHPAPDRRQKQNRRRGLAGRHRCCRSLLLLPHAGKNQSAGYRSTFAL